MYVMIALFKKTLKIKTDYRKKKKKMFCMLPLKGIENGKEVKIKMSKQ